MHTSIKQEKKGRPPSPTLSQKAKSGSRTGKKTGLLASLALLWPDLAHTQLTPGLEAWEASLQGSGPLWTDVLEHGFLRFSFAYLPCARTKKNSAGARLWSLAALPPLR